MFSSQHRVLWIVCLPLQSGCQRLFLRYFLGITTKLWLTLWDSLFLFICLPLCSSVCLSTCIYYFWLFLCLSASAFLTLADSNQPFSEQILIIIVIKFLVDWKTELLEYIDEDNLPEYYGGTCKDPDGDPLCRSKVGSKSFQS